MKRFIFAYCTGGNTRPHLGVVSAPDPGVAEAAVRQFYALDPKVDVVVADKQGILFNNLKAEVTVNVSSRRI